VIASIVLVAVLYLAMNLSIIGVLPWRGELHSSAIVADLMSAVYGSWAAKAVSGLILIAAWGSAYTNLLGYSRIPYAAAVDGSFPAMFRRVRERDGVPVVSLLFMGLASASLCFLSLDALIASLILVQVLLQFVAQCVAVMVLRARHPTHEVSLFRMPLFPLPAVIAIAGWIYIAATSGSRYLWSAGLLSLCGVAFYLFLANRKQEWPFRHA
jgi:amino acid transporter